MTKVIFNPKIKLFLFTFIYFLVHNSYSSQAEEELHFGITAGASIPSETVGRYTNTDNILLQLNNKDSLAQVASDVVNTGYNLGFKLKLPMSEQLSFSGGLTIHRFPENDVIVTDPKKITDTLLILREVNNYIPIDAGIELNLIPIGIADIYVVGNLSYNFLYQTVDIKEKKDAVTVPIKVTNSKINNRIGYSIGAGVKFPLKLVDVGLELKFNRSNLLFKADEENKKSFFTLNAFLVF